MKAAKLETGTSLTLQLWTVHIQSSGFALAAILTDSAVVTWGAHAYDGNSRAVQGQLKGAQQIQASQLLQLSGRMDQLLPGARDFLEGTVVLCKIS